RVREGGTLVVNADDAGALSVLDRRAVRAGTKEVVLFSLSPENRFVRAHLAEGGTAYFVRDGWFVEACGAVDVRALLVDRVPITFGGHAAYNVANALGALAACRTLGLTLAEVSAAFRRFGNTTHNEGRANVYRLGRGHVVLDYGHNADGFEAVGRFLHAWRPGATTIGVVNVPGDRSDALIRAAAQAAARAFSRLVFSEDKDLRGRMPGEVTALLREAAEVEAPDVPIEVIPDEVDALHAVLDRVRDGAVAVSFYEHLEPLVALLQEAGAVPEEPASRKTKRVTVPERITAGGGAASGGDGAASAKVPVLPGLPTTLPAALLERYTPESMEYGAG